MTALVRWSLAELAGSQRFFAPVLAFLAVLGVFFSGPPGPALDGYAATSIALFWFATWTAWALLESEDDTSRLVTASAAGGPVRPAAGRLLAAGLVVLGLVVTATMLPPLLGAFLPAPARADVLTGLAAGLVTALSGIALAALCTRPLIRRPAPAIVVMVLIALLTMAEPGPPAWVLPPVIPVARALSYPEGGLAPLLRAGLGSAALSAAAFAVHLVVVRRRA